MTDELKKNLIHITIYLIVGLIFFIVMILGAVGKPPYGFITIIAIVFVFTSIARILRGTWKYKRLLFVSKVIVFIGLFNFILFFAISWIQNSKVKKDSTILLDLVEQYKIDNETYPDQLADLTPKYIKELPVVWIGLVKRDFKYDFKESYNGTNFQISYDRFFGESFLYSKIDKKWIKIK